jgi:hypothetical protein
MVIKFRQFLRRECQIDTPVPWAEIFLEGLLRGRGIAENLA